MCLTANSQAAATSQVWIFWLALALLAISYPKMGQSSLPTHSATTDPVTLQKFARLDTALRTAKPIEHLTAISQPLATQEAIPKQSVEVNPDKIGAVAQYSFSHVLNSHRIERAHWQSFDYVLPEYSTSVKTAKNTFVVVLDPGHGGSDSGAISTNGLREKHLTLDIARRVSLFLSEVDGIEVVLTRSEDRGMSRRNRVKRIRHTNADLVVSLHFNNLPQHAINLVETFFAAPENIALSQAQQLIERQRQTLLHTHTDKPLNLSFTKDSERLAGILQRRVFNEVKHSNPDADDAGVKQDTLYVLTRSFTPGVLIEISCLSNPDEAKRLTEENYRNQLAAALADGIREYQQSKQELTLAQAGI